MKTVFFVVNKTWEVEPVLNALTQKEFRPKDLAYPQLLHSPRPDDYRGLQPRAVFELTNNGAVAMRAVLWCVRDLMDAAKSESSSEEKYRVLPAIYQQAIAPVDLVIAVGTAASVATDRSLGGSVLLGGQFFLHDSRAADPSNQSRLDLAEYGQLIDGGTPATVFHLLTAYFQANNTAARLLPLMNLPALVAGLPVPTLPQVFVDGASVSLGTLNVVDYTTYNVADQATLTAFAALGALTAQPTVSVETTHGLIRLTAPAGVPALFVSGIANRVLNYVAEATRPHRYLAAFNTGVVLGDMMLALAADTTQW